MNYMRLAAFARSVKKQEDKLAELNNELKEYMNELAEDAKMHGYILWRKEDGTYFWENQYREIANYPTLSEAILAYGSETIDF